MASLLREATRQTTTTTTTNVCTYVDTYTLLYIALGIIGVILLIALIVYFVSRSRIRNVDPIPPQYKAGSYSIFRYEEVDPRTYR